MPTSRYYFQQQYWWNFASQFDHQQIYVLLQISQLRWLFTS